MKVLALVVLVCLSASAFSRSLDSSFEVHSRSLLTDDAPQADLNRFFERGLLEDAPFRALYDTATFHRAQFPIEKPFFAQDLISIAPAVQGPGGNITAWTLGQNPALYELGATGNGRGMAQARASFNPCGLNLPHVHPRGIEFIHVLYGEIQFTFFEENGGRVITLDLSEGMSTFVPTGLYHTSHNLKCDPAAFLATFNHNDPGTSTILQQHVNLPLPTLSTTFGGAFSDEQLMDIKDVVTNTINFAQGPSECLERCGISHP